MLYETDAYTSVKLTLSMSTDEATTLMHMMQNPLHQQESPLENEVRRTVFTALNEILTRG